MTLETLSVQAVMQPLGWVLIHSLWQGAIISILLRAALILMRRNTANVRYAVACAALFVMLAMPLGSVWISEGSRMSGVSNAAQTEMKSVTAATLWGSSSVLTDAQTATPTPAWKHRLEQQLEKAMPWMIFVWLVGVLFSSVRWYFAWVHTRRLVRSEMQLILKQWQVRLKHLARRLRVSRPVLLFESSLVRTPTVIGWLRPVIFLPTSTLTGLTPQQLETILAHELAHIRRYDYLVNLLQTGIETLMFYHPGMWWTSRQIRIERELCCDDLAVSITGDPTVYARALTRMERLRKSTPQFAMAASGGSLTSRIHRLVEVEAAPPVRFAGFWRVAVVILAVAAVAISAQVSRVYTSQAADSKRQTTDGQSTSVRPSSLLASQDGALPQALKRSQELRSLNPETRAQAICSLGKSNDTAHIPILVAALGDDTTMFSPVGCWTSGTWSPALQVFKHPSPGEEAAMALASFGAAAVDPLVNALQDANPSVRRNAAWAIGEIRSGLSVDRGHAIPLLFAALADDDPWVRRAAAFSLGEIREDSAAAALIGRLGDEAAGVREMAARALGEMKAPGALRPLAVAVNDQDKQVSRAARWALSEVLSQPLTNSN